MALQSRERENSELGASVAAVEILRGVSLGKASGLGFFQGFAERDAGALDAAENVVARAVQNAGNPVQAIAAKPCTQRWQHRHTAGDGRSATDRKPHVSL